MKRKTHWERISPPAIPGDQVVDRTPPVQEPLKHTAVVVAKEFLEWVAITKADRLVIEAAKNQGGKTSQNQGDKKARRTGTRSKNSKSKPKRSRG